jgi:hypothetical protein
VRRDPDGDAHGETIARSGPRRRPHFFPDRSLITRPATMKTPLPW